MWVDIKEFENLYQVNEYGKVRSLSRTQKNHSKLQNVPEKILKQCIVGKGYFTVCLRNNNKTYRKYIHRIVAENFIENEYNLPIINHKDGNKKNNYYENLEWTTYSENNQHAYDTDLKHRGEDFYNSKLSVDDVIKILQNGKYDTYENIATNYGVSKATIKCVLDRKTWKYIYV